MKKEMDFINPEFNGLATGSESRDNTKRRLDEMILNDQRNIAKLKKVHAYLRKKIKEVPPHMQKTMYVQIQKVAKKILEEEKNMFDRPQSMDEDSDGDDVPLRPRNLKIVHKDDRPQATDHEDSDDDSEDQPLRPRRQTGQNDSDAVSALINKFRRLE
jgi:hypothetical protein